LARHQADAYRASKAQPRSPGRLLQEDATVTEVMWLAATEPYPLADYLRTKMQANRTKYGRRKLKLFGCACCRQIWHLFEAHPDCARLVEKVEQFADHGGSQRFLNDLARGLRPVGGPGWQVVIAARSLARSKALEAGIGASGVIASAIDTAGPTPQASSTLEEDGEFKLLNGARAKQAHLLRCLFGNPFRPVTLDPSWLTSTVVTLAKGIYDDRAFDRLPILADALQEAGCNNDDILNHCRGPGPHARGCWVVDLVLGKT
jgi:hypothetical protein